MFKQLQSLDIYFDAGLIARTAVDFAEETVDLNAGEMYVVPKGIQHKPYAEEECKVMLVEPKGVVNTGEAESDLTASNDVWI